MAALSTPTNTISRDNLIVLIRNNVMNTSCDFSPDNDLMETDSPVRQPISLQPINKKLFHSPMHESPKGTMQRSSVERFRRARKRKHMLLPDASERIKKAYVKECGEERCGPPARAHGVRNKVLISLFHNKEYSMDFD